MKLHLKGSPKNEGARLLGRRIMAGYRGIVPVAAGAMKLSIPTIMKLVDGDLIPGEELVADVAKATNNAITRADWRTAPRGGWFDAVDAFADRKAA
jgi:hypothetical protein